MCCFQIREWVVAAGLVILTAVNVSTADWVRFRGPNGTGVTASKAPAEFGADKNLQWKLELPGKGVSSPIIVGDRVFVTCYSGYGTEDSESADVSSLERHLLCIERKSGKVIWQKSVPGVPEEDPYRGAGVPAHGYASHTPTSDGERVYAFFGKAGVFAFDLEGNELWKKSVGLESGPMEWGSAASPILHDDTLIVNASDESETLYGFDSKTGDEKWKAEAAGLSSTWGTPALATTTEGTRVVLAVPGEVWGLNAKTGKLTWYAQGNEGASHSVVVSDGVVYSIGGSRGGSNGVAVKLGGKGEIDVEWENRASGRFASPLVYDGYVFGFSGDVFSCYDAKTGEEVFKERLPASTKQSAATGDSSGNGRDRSRRRRGGRFGNQSYSSPILADGKIYYVTGSGTAYVVAAKPEFEIIATNDLSFDSSGFQGTPAVDDGQLFIRSHSHLYCFGE